MTSPRGASGRFDVGRGGVEEEAKQDRPDLMLEVFGSIRRGTLLVLIEPACATPETISSIVLFPLPSKMPEYLVASEEKL